ncbi:hypothetical protein D3C81_1528200 [compost metagenome]
MRCCCSFMPFPVSVRRRVTLRRSCFTTSTRSRPPCSIDSRALAIRLLKICPSNSGCPITCIAGSGFRSRVTPLRASAVAKVCKLSCRTWGRSTGIVLSSSGRSDCSNWRIHCDMRSTWLMMSLMLRCAGPSSYT